MEVLNAYCNTTRGDRVTKTWLRASGRLTVEHTVWEPKRGVRTPTESLTLYHEGSTGYSWLDIPASMDMEDMDDMESQRSVRPVRPVQPLTDEAEYLGEIRPQTGDDWQVKLLSAARSAIQALAT